MSLCESRSRLENASACAQLTRPSHRTRSTRAVALLQPVSRGGPPAVVLSFAKSLKRKRQSNRNRCATAIRISRVGIVKSANQERYFGFAFRRSVQVSGWHRRRKVRTFRQSSSLQPVSDVMEIGPHNTEATPVYDRRSFDPTMCSSCVAVLALRIATQPQMAEIRSIFLAQRPVKSASGPSWWSNST